MCGRRHVCMDELYTTFLEPELCIQSECCSVPGLLQAQSTLERIVSRRRCWRVRYS